MDDAIEKKVFCAYLLQSEERLSRAPFPGKLGEIIFNNVSQKAWDAWLVEQTKLMNEYRLNPMERVHREQIRSAMKTFLSLDKLCDD